MAQDLYGLAFQIDLAIDNDPVMEKIYAGTFKGVTTVQHTLGKSVETTLELVGRYVPKEKWPLMYWHGSPSCKEGSTINLFNQDINKFVKSTKWMISLFRTANPGSWTVEQISRILTYLKNEPVWVRNLDMHEFTAMSSKRRRTIASKNELVFKKLTQDQLENKMVSPKSILGRTHNLNPDAPLLLKSSMGYIRDATKPAFTVTGSTQSFGHSEAQMARVSPKIMLQLMDIDESEWTWPEGMSETAKLKMGAQSIPSSFGVEMALAVHNSRLPNCHSFGGEGGGDEDYLPDVVNRENSRAPTKDRHGSSENLSVYSEVVSRRPSSCSRQKATY
mmetsp:Transcript_31077/g.96125  ORF Transcript_31077/g.96125 Transcript_31077/m.96125 type:complete len:333 (-) Transcript_31077:4407-5405(-)